VARAKDRDQLRCSFCGRGQSQVKKVIAGPGVYICDVCVDLCNEVIADTLATTPTIQPVDESVEDALARTAALFRSRDQVDREVTVHVRQLRDRGVTWSRIGDALGMTRQSAWERFSGEE